MENQSTLTPHKNKQEHENRNISAIDQFMDILPIEDDFGFKFEKNVIILLQTKEHTCNNCPRLFPLESRLMSPTTLQINTRHLGLTEAW